MKSLRHFGVLCCLLATSVPGRVGADSAFHVYDSSGIFTDSSLTTLLPAGALVQLIWTADNLFAPYVPGQLDDAGYFALAGDYLLLSTNTPINGGWAGDLDGGLTVYTSADVGGNPLPSGYVYLRVFEDGTPSAGEGFVNSALVPVFQQATNVPPDVPQLVDISPAPGDGVFPTVPEPASVSFVALGLAIVARRYRAMKSAAS